jgi:hypothetical protein
MLKQMSKGEFQTHQITSKDELGEMATSLNQQMEGLKSTTSFAHQLDRTNWSKPPTLSTKDEPVNALLDIRSNLSMHWIKNTQEGGNYIRGWVNEGLAKFGDILRKTNNLTCWPTASFKTCNYLEANQGVILFTTIQKTTSISKCFRFRLNRKNSSVKPSAGEGLVEPLP